MRSFRLILISSCISFFISCKFEYSPYAANAPELGSNHKNLQFIQEAEVNTADNFKVAFISDTHNYYQELKQLIRAINNNGPYSFVVINGDITNLGLLEEFKKTLQYLKHINYPFLVVAGNHDLITNGHAIYHRMFGELNFSLEFKNTQFIFYNNNNWESPGEVPSYPWVMDKLRSSNAEFKILTAHIPPSDRKRFSLNLMENWRSMVNSEGVDYIFSGHGHSPVVETFGNAVNITIGSPAKRGYFELLISPGMIHHQKISF
jgi:3',5'-cyclic-AMP phosphodiesterase